MLTVAATSVKVAAGAKPLARAVNPMMISPINNALQRLKEPLRRCAACPPFRLPRMGGVGAAVLLRAKELRALLEDAKLPALAAVAAGIGDAFKDFDQKTPNEQQTAAASALAEVAKIENALAQPRQGVTISTGAALEEDTPPQVPLEIHPFAGAGVGRDAACRVQQSPAVSPTAGTSAGGNTPTQVLSAARPSASMGAGGRAGAGASPRSLVPKISPVVGDAKAPPDKSSRMEDSVQYLSGVGPRLAALLGKKEIHTVKDLLYFLPRQYEDRRKIVSIAEAPIGARATIIAAVLSAGFVIKARKRAFEALLGDHRQQLRLSWFHGNFGHLAKNLVRGAKVLVAGEVRLFGGIKSLVHPDWEMLADDKEGEEGAPHLRHIIPIYSETEGLNSKTLRRIMRTALDGYAHLLEDALPPHINAKYRFPPLSQSLRYAHFPPDDADVDSLNASHSRYHQHIIYDEFFFLQLGIALKRSEQAVERGVSCARNATLLEQFYRSLPFSPTRAQLRVAEEILADMARPVAMNRLLQGDVGSGKTLVAFVAMLTACANGYRAILMAPTELLAIQHQRNIAAWAAPFGLPVSLLVGSSSSAQRRTATERMERGEAGITIGTHALLHERLSIANLGLVVIDEQHRFGVAQRATLRDKGLNPDMLVMTATPIPRTLAMTLYGDLEVSILDELPAHKKPIKTKVYSEAQRLQVYAVIRAEVGKGNQAFIVYPLVEETDAPGLRDAKRMAEHLQRDVFPEFALGLVHGRMKSGERDEIMGKFQRGELNILVATTVVEVGIDVPEASLMVVENAERFGLSQLHQLRGRVGRGKAQSFCLLLAQHTRSNDARRRLKIMEETGDGFKIAEEDLAIRGPGEFLGVKQSGIPYFRVGDIIRDFPLLAKARNDALELVAGDARMASPANRRLLAELKKRWQGRLRFSQA